MQWWLMDLSLVIRREIFDPPLYYIEMKVRNVSAIKYASFLYDRSHFFSLEEYNSIYSFLAT